jgi:hypothetical protein
MHCLAKRSTTNVREADMPSITLPKADGSFETYTLGPASHYPSRASAPFNRVAYAAAHVVADPKRVDTAGMPMVDWDATMAFRHHLWGLGFKIAEAMDTSQRGMGLGWPEAKELIARSLGEARAVKGADLAAGAGTDQLDPLQTRGLDDVIAAYEEQFAHVEKHGGRAIMMASRALARAAKGPEDYLKVYGRLLAQAKDKVILHWLGDMFDPALAGYWGSQDVAKAMDTVCALIETLKDKVDGIKISLLDAAHEIALRRRLPDGVKMYTGDDFNYAELIAGDERGHSHALLGIFDPIAPAAAEAFRHLAEGNLAEYDRILEPTVALSRKIFEAPTWNYKSGVVFLAWLNGHQDHFTMIGRKETARDMLHYAEVFRLADQCGLLADPDLAAKRMASLATPK